MGMKITFFSVTTIYTLLVDFTSFAKIMREKRGRDRNIGACFELLLVQTFFSLPVCATLCEKATTMMLILMRLEWL